MDFDYKRWMLTFPTCANMQQFLCPFSPSQEPDGVRRSAWEPGPGQSVVTSRSGVDASREVSSVCGNSFSPLFRGVLFPAIGKGPRRKWEWEPLLRPPHWTNPTPSQTGSQGIFWRYNLNRKAQKENVLTELLYLLHPSYKFYNLQLWLT